MKTEPETFSWDNLLTEGKTTWDGVRNYAARNHMRAMKKGDKALIYHSVSEKAVVGIAKISKEAFPDPSADDDTWSAVEVVPDKPLKIPVTLDQIKAEKTLKDMMLIRIGRLSVMPVTKAEFDKIVSLGK
jgi:predicted RNA-binding protein with PUA-like domain